MSTASKSYLTPEEYLALDNQSEFRNEYVEGEVFAMARASKNHRSIVLNSTRHLGITPAGSMARSAASSSLLEPRMCTPMY